MRDCNGCTACCEGWLVGKVQNKYFQPGRPCHFKCESGCSIYEQRPENPCRIYSCEWLNNLDIPEWLRPNLSKIIITRKQWKNGDYLEITEMGCKIDSTILNWLFTYHYSTDIPIRIQVSGGWTSYGPQEFLNEVYGLKINNGN
jgi:hypothetical protein